MAGGTLSAAGSFRGSVTVPQGLNFVVGDVLGPTGFLSNPSESFNTEVHVNRFSMDYYESGEVGRQNFRIECTSSFYLLLLLNVHHLSYSFLDSRFHSFVVIFRSLILMGRR